MWLVLSWEGAGTCVHAMGHTAWPWPVSGDGNIQPSTKVGSDTKREHLFLMVDPLQFVTVPKTSFSLRSSFLRNLCTRAVTVDDTKTPNAPYYLPGNQARM